MNDGTSIYDFDWGGGTATAAPPVESQTAPEEPAPPPEPATPPEPAPRRGRQRSEIDPELLPPAYRDYEGRKNVYKRPSTEPVASVYDYDWGDANVAAGPAYNPASDFDITRGVKVGYGGTADAMSGAAEMARIATLPADQQAAEMLKQQPAEPGAAQLQVPDITDINSVGKLYTFLMESVGQTAGSWLGAAEYGGLPGAALGAGVGGVGGATVGGAGALPGAVAGGGVGFGYGTMAAFGTMGVGGMYRDLLSDPDVRKGLEDGTITPQTITAVSASAGSVIGAIDAVPGAKFLSKVGGKKVTKEMVKVALKEAVKKGLKHGVLEEGGTEALQGAISEIGQAAVGGNIDAVNRGISVINQGVVGGIGGAGPGAVGEVTENAGLPSPGGVGNVAPPPIGAKPTTPTTPAAPTPAAGPTVVKPGEVAPEIAAAAAPAAAGTTPEAAVQEGDENFDPNAPDEYAAAAPVDPTVAAALNAGKPKPAEAAAPQPAEAPAAPPEAPAPPAEVPDLYRSGESSYQPGGPPAENVPVTPQVQTEQPAAPAAPAAVAEPAITPEPAAREVVTKQPTLEALVGQQPEADVARTRQLEGLANFASAIEPVWDDRANGYVVEQSDLKDAQDKLQQLSKDNDSEAFHAFWNALDDHVKAALDRWASKLQPEFTPPARQAAPPERARALAAPVEPAAPAAPPRAAVTLKPKEVEAARVVKEPPPVARKTMRMTLQHYRNVVNAQGAAAAQALLEKATIRHAKSRRRLGVVTGATEQGVTVSYRSKKKPLSVEELLGKHAVETEVQVSGKQPPLKPEKTGRDAVIEQLRKYFKVGKRKAVQLKPLGFSDAEIADLEHRGLAETGSMDAAEFGRWEVSRRGAVAEPTGRPLSEGNIEPKVVPYIELKRKPEPGAEAAKAKAEEEAKPYVREPTGPLQGAKNIFKKGRKVGRGSQLRQQVELELAQRISEEAPYEGQALTEAELAKRAQESIGIVEARADAAARAASEIAKGKKSAPAQLARAHLETAVNRAIELFNKGEQTREEARQAILDADKELEDEQLAEAKRLAAVYREEELAAVPQKGERTGADKGKSFAGLAKEDDNTIRQRAYAEEKKNPNLPRNQLRLDMAAIFHKLQPLQRRKDKAGIKRRNLLWSKVRVLHQQLVAEQREVDKTAKRELLKAEAQERRDEKFATETMARAVEAGLISEEEATALAANKKASKQYKAKIARARKSRPALMKAIKAHPMAIDTHRADMLGLGKQIRLWGADLVAAAERELRKAGAKLPNKRSRFFATPEENGILFIKQALSGKVEKGLGLNDAWMIGHLLGERAAPKKRGISDEQWLMDLHNNEDEIYGTIFDASKTAATGYALDKPGPGRAKVSTAQVRLDNRQQEVWDQEQQAERAEGPMADQLRRWAREHGLLAEVEAGHILPEDVFGSREEAQASGLPLGQHAQKMTAAQAVDRFVTGSKAMEGTPPWQRWIRKYVTRHMRELVGDTPVYFVDGAVISSFSEDASQRRGLFIRRSGEGKPNVILLHEGLRGSPKQLANTMFHELTHAATAHALQQNIRGTRDAVVGLMKALERQLGGEIPEEHKYAMSKPEEFITAGLEHSPFQDLLASLNPDAKALAQVHALGKGRTMPTYWDLFVGMVQRAIGAFTGGNGGRSYLDQVLKIYPHVAMSSAEQRADAAAQRERAAVDGGNKVLSYPHDFASYKPYADDAWKTAQSLAGRTVGKLYRGWVESTENLDARVASEAFGGNYDNPYHDSVREFTSKRRKIENEMRDGDQALNDISRWYREDLVARGPELGDAHAGLLEASLDGIDPRIPFADNKWVWHDALHPTKRKRKAPTQKHLRDTYKRASYDRGKEAWDKIPDDLKPKLSTWLDLMKEKMNRHDLGMVRNWLQMLQEKETNPVKLPAGLSMDDAVQQIFDGEMSEELTAALGDNAETMAAIGRHGMREQMYVPASREGQHFISGRRKIATPDGATFDQAEFDKTGRFKFIFNNAKDATDYMDEMGATGNERVTRFNRRWVDPRTGETVPHDFQEFDAAGNEYVASPRYYVTMQDRFMAMSDSAEHLDEMRTEMLKEGEYQHISTPMLLSEQRNQAGAMMPQQLNKMIHQIDSMAGPSEEEKANAKAMVTTSFIKNQQGNRVTKRMLKREGVYGYNTGAEELLRSGKTNNDMMSRRIVEIETLLGERKTEAALKDFQEAWSHSGAKSGIEALARLKPHLQQQITRNLGKDDTLAANRLSEDVRELNNRKAAARQLHGGKKFGEDAYNAISTLTMMRYLGDVAYHAVNAMGFAMQSLPAFISYATRTQGFAGAHGAARRYMGKASARVQWRSNYGAGLSEMIAEGKDLAAGLKPRAGYLAGSRGQRRARDLVEEVKQRVLANSDDPLREGIADLIDDAKLNNMIGRAGLDQPNLRTDKLGAGPKGKLYRGIESAARVSQAFSEGTEVNNRLTPLIMYYEFERDQGTSHEQAKAIAMNRMTREQTGYAKENWPSWMTGRGVRMVMMFKQFALTQAINYYGGLWNMIGPHSSSEDRLAAATHVLYMSAVGVALGGFSGNPLWEPFRLLMWLFGFGGSWDNLKTKGEKWMADYIGKMPAEVAMYGLPRLVGLDLSSRVAADNLLFFQQPKEMSADEWYKVAGRTVLGPIGDLGVNAAKAIYNPGSDQTWPKWLSELPVPKQVKDLLNTYDIAANGPRTATGISAGKPPPYLESIIQALGFRTRSQERPFEQGSVAKRSIEHEAIQGRNDLLQRVLNQGITSDNMRLIREWDKEHPDKTERITVKSISEARKRRRNIEHDITAKNVE